MARPPACAAPRDLRGALRSVGFEIADAKADQACLHAIDDARAFDLQVFTFAVSGAWRPLVRG